MFELLLLSFGTLAALYTVSASLRPMRNSDPFFV